MSGVHDSEDSGWVCLEQETVDVPKTKRSEQRRYKPKRAKKSRPKRKRRWMRGISAAAASLIVLYCVLVFSNIPFIEKWRTIYIETAMGTMTHQWLATAFLPQSLIDEVMNSRITLELQQESINSSWDIGTAFDEGETASATDPWKDIQARFFSEYPEIDEHSFEQYLETHEMNALLDNDGYLLIDAADYNASDTGIRTIYGDSVCAIDTRNGIIIVTLEGDGYEGRMAIVKNPAQVRLAASETLGSSGSYLKEICEENGAVLGINASGFSDPNGTGNGGKVFGMVFANGRSVYSVLDAKMKVISMNYSNRLNITSAVPPDTRDAMQFSPALVVNGEQLISGSSGWGLQPRSVIGQTRNGSMLLAIVDGRQPGYSIGITLGDLTDILYEYGAYQACNLDGGSSAVMYYRGRNITHSSAATPRDGRHIPNAWIVESN